MTKKTREELAAEGFLIIASRTAERREREKKEKQGRPAPATATVDTGARQFRTDVANPASLAAQIIRAGQRARGELDDDTASMPSGLAGEIIRAGQRRRGEQPT
jgi:hypothetical protein